MSMKEAVVGIGQHSNMMPVEADLTLPIVEFGNNSIIVRRLIYYVYLDPRQSTISSPQYIATYNLTRNRFVSLERTNLILPDLPLAPWVHLKPSFNSPQDILQEYERIWELYDKLIPAYLESMDGSLKTDTRALAIEYMEYFNRHAEIPLMPYYDHFGGDFLNWIKSRSH